VPPPEIIVDPNVWVSALISPGGTTAGVLRAVLSDEVTAIVTPHLLEELSAVLERDKFRRWVSLAEARAFVAALSDKADLRPDAGKPRRSARDPDDDYLVAADPVRWRNLLAALADSALAQAGEKTVHLHRLIQAILRDQLPAPQAAAIRAQTETMLAASSPGSPAEPASWTGWAALLPHLLAADLAATGNPALRAMACAACEYLIASGDPRAALGLADELLPPWRGTLGDDDEHVLAMAHGLGWALREMGRYAEARDQHQEVLDRKRRLLGWDHPSTLTIANHLAADLRDLGELPAARDLARSTLEDRRRILGADHPDTLRSATNLAVILSRMGSMRAAHDLDQDTLERRRRVLGDGHPLTRFSATSLESDAEALRALDET
jgi:putative PIN family toxin of toxin-antitoxin system